VKMSNKTLAGTKEQRVEFERLLEVLRYSIHELPAGVLGGPDAATPKQCAHLMEDLRRFEELGKLVAREMTEFVEDCRWHFEHYPHYLSRSRHFQGYGDYIARREGPLRVRMA
jgi:hypothetical protein